MLSTSSRLMWVMMSPSFSPQSRAGVCLPSAAATSPKPTTITPSENSLIPTVRPIGITSLVSAALAG